MAKRRDAAPAVSGNLVGGLLRDPPPRAGRDALLTGTGPHLVRVPRPERYAIHKILVAARRTGRNNAKRRKDLAQAVALLEVLVEESPVALGEAYRAVRKRGPTWRRLIATSAPHLPARGPEILAALARGKVVLVSPTPSPRE